MARRKSIPRKRKKNRPKPSPRKKKKKAPAIKPPVISEIDERARDRERKRRQRAAGRDVEIPPVADPARKAACEADVFLFMRTYLAAKFFKPFTDDQREIITDILRCWRYGEDQAIAAARGDGKTSDAEGVLIYVIVYGKLKFPVIIGATGPAAKGILDNVKAEFEDNDLLAADFPEICEPIRALEGANQRAAGQTVNGVRTRMQWAGRTVVFPKVEGSKASESIITSRGLDGAIRGIRHRNQRPDGLLIDDADTAKTAGNEEQTAKLVKRIEMDLGGLAGPGRRLGRALLATIPHRKSVAFVYTDRSLKPSWNGRRYKLLAQPPERVDLWETYVLKRQTEGREAATAFYKERREDMDRGAVVSNPHRVEAGQLSPVQHCYDIIADRGEEAFRTEYQNDPPEEETPESAGLTAPVIQTRVNNLRRGVVPLTVTEIVVGFDVGERACHWAAVGWEPGARGYVIDYGVAEVYRTNKEDDAGIDAAIRRTLHIWREERLREPYHDEGGTPRPLKYVVVDSGDRTDAVYGFVKEAGLPFRASKGQSPYRPPKEADSITFIGDHWYARQQTPSGVWLHTLDTDHWKRWRHDRLGTDVNGRGSLSLFGTREDARQHLSFAKHCTAEVFDAESRRWVKENMNNHWGDALYMACVAASMAKISLSIEASKPQPPANRPPIAPPAKPFVQSWRGRY